jgi:peptide/nickel transport system permease protein
MNLIQNLIRRLLLMIPMSIGITLLLFVVTHIVPVNPLAVILTERSMDDPEAIRAATEKWGLDKPLPEQYLIYLGNLLQGDLGTSFKTKNPVASDLKNFLPATIELSICSFIFAILLGLPLGIISAIKTGSFVDQVTRGYLPFGRFDATFLVGAAGFIRLLLQTALGSGTGSYRFTHGRSRFGDRPFCF